MHISLEWALRRWAMWLCGEGSGLAAGVYVMAFSLSQPGGCDARKPATGRMRDGRGRRLRLQPRQRHPTRRPTVLASQFGEKSVTVG